jgi:hypothetical protein
VLERDLADKRGEFDERTEELEAARAGREPGTDPGVAPRPARLTLAEGRVSHRNGSVALPPGTHLIPDTMLGPDPT